MSTKHIQKHTFFESLKKSSLKPWSFKKLPTWIQIQDPHILILLLNKLAEDTFFAASNFLRSWIISQCFKHLCISLDHVLSQIVPVSLICSFEFLLVRQNHQNQEHDKNTSAEPPWFCQQASLRWIAAIVQLHWLPGQYDTEATLHYALVEIELQERRLLLLASALLGLGCGERKKQGTWEEKHENRLYKLQRTLIPGDTLLDCCNSSRSCESSWPADTQISSIHASQYS